jgi:hypothetical protein
MGAVQDGWLAWACPADLPVPAGMQRAAASQTWCGHCAGPLPDGYAYYSMRVPGPACRQHQGRGPWICPPPGPGCDAQNCLREMPPQ